MTVVPAGAKSQPGVVTDVGIVWTAAAGKNGVVLRMTRAISTIA